MASLLINRKWTGVTRIPGADGVMKHPLSGVTYGCINVRKIKVKNTG